MLSLNRSFYEYFTSVLRNDVRYKNKYEDLHC